MTHTRTAADTEEVNDELRQAVKLVHRGFEAEGHPACKLSAALEATGGYATVAKKKAAPKIFLDRSEDKSLTVKAGNNLKLDIPVSGDNVNVKWRRGPKVSRSRYIPTS